MNDSQMLKYIKLIRHLNYTTATKETQKHIDHLKEKGYVDFDIVEKNDNCFYMFALTPAGREYLHQSKKGDRQWLITTIIAIIAAIGAYRSELTLIGQAAMKLWISLMGD